MIKKKKNKTKKDAPSSIVPYSNSTGNPIVSNFREMFQQVSSASQSGVEEPHRALSFDDLRWMGSKIPHLSAIINKRADQYIQFCKPQLQKNEKGFIIQMANPNIAPTDVDVKNMDYLKRFIMRTTIDGVHNELNFPKLMRASMRDLFLIDQLAVEIRRNKRDDVIGFYGVDGGTIRRTTEYIRAEHKPDTSLNLGIGYNENFKERGIQFVQVVQNVKRAEFTHRDMVFSYMNPRHDLKFYGYGYSYFEQAIDIATMLTYTLEYNKGYFRFDKLPKGMLLIQGLGDDTAKKVQEYIHAMMSGAGGKWKIPILPLSDTGKDVQWLNFNQSNRDMEFYKFIMFLTAIFAAICGIDIAEIGLRSDSAQNFISNDATDDKIRHSKDSGLGAILTFFEDYINQIVSKISNRYVFKFAGYDLESEKDKLEIKKKELETFKSVNDVLKEYDKKPYELIVGGVNVFDIPGIQNQQIFQLVQSYIQDQQMKQQQKQQGGEQSNDEQPEDENEDLDVENF